MSARLEMLLACYRSGQVSARQWAEHLLHEPGLVAYVQAREALPAPSARVYRAVRK